MRPSLRLAVFASIVFISFGCGPSSTTPAPPTFPPAAPLSADARAENPLYTWWASAAPGTGTVYDEIVDVAGTTTRGRRAYRLLSRSDAAAEVEAKDISSDGRASAQEAQTLKHLRWMVKPANGADPARPQGTYATGDETITVHGKSYQTKWYKFKGHVEAGETDTQNWYAVEVPGGLVKSVHTIPAIKKTVTVELAEVKTP